ncbi:hypothetical protein E1I69_07975 [Bacillus timonensis]|uniref:Uracil DNA glycosylase superfamily protein n=1 Tax=Bacillus timonensis TaxID=1033734 RepID=A0A4S3PW95_9BACI|nr:hypothetical protein [Bacillus timonensis]THE13272.1 hypothetical protein E1I69_07975 [Bacillus timonensis]
MAIAPYSKFDTFKSKILSLPVDYTEEDLKIETFLLEKDEKKNLEIYYAPFEYVNEAAKVMIVGITPGMHQMKRSYSTILDPSNKGLSDEQLLHQVKKNSSFEGPMRKNLIQMLDELGLHSYLEISSTSELFRAASHLVQTSSVITYPVFYKGKNYSGSTPKMLKTDVLKKYVVECFVEEIKSLQNPLIIPLGVNVTAVLDYLVESGYVSPDSVLYGFPHTSGGNGHRHRQFAENKEQMKQKLATYFS